MNKFVLVLFLGLSVIVPAWGSEPLPLVEIIKREVTKKTPSICNAYYCSAEGKELRTPRLFSSDNGKTWSPAPLVPDTLKRLPNGYRRNCDISVRDPKTGNIITVLNALDVLNLDPKISEPTISKATYYMRYRVSKDHGKTWLFEKPIIAQGKEYTQTHPYKDIYIGRNSFYLGDTGCRPIIRRDGAVLVPCQMTVLGDNPNEIWINPAGTLSFTDCILWIGTWKDDHLVWDRSDRVGCSYKDSTRGLIEPTLYEAPDGRILMVMRGSNGGKIDPDCKIPSYRWRSISSDGGKTWSTAEPWTYDTGEKFFSPSSMSMLFVHSSGRCFWFGNINHENCRYNSPRHPMMMGEVDPKSLTLIKSTMTTIDSFTKEDEGKGRLDMSHVTVLEDRETGDIILCYVRSNNAGKDFNHAMIRMKLRPKQ